MSIASALLQQHIQTLVDDNAQWQTLIADDIVWELAYAPALGHPARLSGREAVVGHATWFLGAVEHFRFFDLKVYAFADPEGAVAEVKAEALIKPTGRVYQQEYVAVPARCTRQDCVPTRVFRSRACGQRAGHADSGSRVLRTATTARSCRGDVQPPWAVAICAACSTACSPMRRARNSIDT